jgi:hypothetical protein
MVGGMSLGSLKSIFAWIYGTAGASGYPSDSSRSLLEWDRRTDRGLCRCGSRICYSPRLDVRGASSSPPRAASGRTGRSRLDHLLCYRLLRHHARPSVRSGMVPRVWRLPAALSPFSATTHSLPAGDGAAWRATTCGGCQWDRFPPYSHTLSGQRRALLISQWSWVVCRAAIGVVDRWTTSPLTTSGTFSRGGPGWCCRWRIAVSAILPQGGGAGVPGPTCAFTAGLVPWCKIASCVRLRRPREHQAGCSQSARQQQPGHLASMAFWLELAVLAFHHSASLLSA